MVHILGLEPEIDLYAEFQRALAAQLDQIRSFTPPNFEINLVLVHKTDPQAHMVVGQSAPLAVRKAIDETLADRGNFTMEGNAAEGFEIVEPGEVQ